jgi:hypothetical protein
MAFLLKVYIIHIKTHNIIQCLLLIQESQYERDAITKKIRKDHDNIKKDLINLIAYNNVLSCLFGLQQQHKWFNH